MDYQHFTSADNTADKTAVRDMWSFPCFPDSIEQNWKWDAVKRPLMTITCCRRTESRPIWGNSCCWLLKCPKLLLSELEGSISQTLKHNSRVSAWEGRQIWNVFQSECHPCCSHHRSGIPQFLSKPSQFHNVSSVDHQFIMNNQPI